MHTCTWLRSLLAGVSALLLLPTAFGQYGYWDTSNGLAIRQGNHITFTHESIAPNGTESFLATWSEAPNGLLEVHAQLFDFDGEPLWAGDDRIVAAGDAPQQEPKAVHTGDGGWVIGWKDFTDADAVDAVGYLRLRKYDASGESLWEIAVHDAQLIYAWEHWKLYPVGEGDVLLVWRMEQQVCVKRFTAAGESAWDTLPVMTDGYAYPLTTAMGPDGTLQVLMMRHSTSGLVVALQKVDDEGVMLLPGEGAVLLNSDDLGTSRILGFTPLPSGGTLVAWYNYMTETMFFQKYDLSGEPQWEMPGQTIWVDMVNIYSARFLTLSEENVLVYTVSHVSRLASFDCSGDTPQVNWIALTPESSYQSNVQLTSRGEGQILLTWLSNDYDLFNLAFDDAGDRRWPEPVSLGQIDAIDEFTSFILDEGIVTLYLGSRGSETGLMIQEQQFDGSVVDEQPRFLFSGTSGYTTDPKVRISGENAFVVWSDSRRSGNGFALFYQVIGVANGEVLTPRNGLPLAPGVLEEFPYQGVDVRMIPDGSGGMLFLWRIYNLGEDSRLMGQRIGPDGSHLWGEDGVIFQASGPDGPREFTNYDFTLTDQGIIAVASIVSEPPYWNGRLYLGWFELDGSEFSPIVPITDESSSCTTSKIRPLAGGDVIVQTGGEQYSLQELRVWLARVNPDVGTLWSRTETLNIYRKPVDLIVQENPGRVVSVFSQMYEPWAMNILQLSLDGEWAPVPVREVQEESVHQETALVLDSKREEIILTANCEGYSTRYFRYNFDGEYCLDTPGGIEFSAYCDRNAVVPDPVGGLYVVMEKPGFCMTDMFITHLDREGVPVHESYGTQGVPLTQMWFEQRSPNAIPDGEGGVIVVWNDWRASMVGELFDDVYGTRFNDGLAGVSADQVRPHPGGWALLPAYPNPFNPSTTLVYSLPASGRIRLTVYDLLGREVTRLVDRHETAGWHQAVWQAPVASGAYFVRYDFPGGSHAQRVVVMK